MKKWIIFVLTFCIFVLGITLISVNSDKKNTLSTYTQTIIFNDEQNVISGKETISFYNYTDNALSKLCLHLYPNAFKKDAKSKVVSLSLYDKAYYNGASYGDIKIESVSCGEKYLDYEIAGEDENILEICPSEPIYPDDVYIFEIGFSVSFSHINHRLGIGKNTINICNYYPIMCVYENGEFKKDLYNSNGDPFYSKVANYEVEITYPKKYMLASTGVQKNIIDEDKKITKILAQNVRDFAMVLSDKFELCEDDFAETKIQYYYYDDTNPKNTVNLIKNVLEYNKKYGAYPYAQISVVEASFVHGGMEYPNIVLISDNLDDYDMYVNVIVHELCHQWWYGIVGNDEYSYGFLDEGLTDYCTAKFYDTYPIYGHSSKEIFHNASVGYCNFIKIYSDVNGDKFSTNMVRDLDEFETESEYVYLCYVKSMLMFASLEDLLGQKKVDSCLKYYCEKNKFDEATPDNLIDAFCRVSGKNLKSFFNSWLNGDVVINDF